MSLSGWCSQRGRPNCAGCRSEGCSHSCHMVELVDEIPTPVGGGRENVPKDTTKRVGPGPKVLATPVQGLADRKDTTDS